MQTATSETESKSSDLSICVHHYTLRAPCPIGQGNLPVPESKIPAGRVQYFSCAAKTADVKSRVCAGLTL